MKKISSLNRYLSAYLRAWLKKSGISQTEAAELLKIDQGQLNGLLNLTRGISLEKLESIALVTGKKALDALSIGKELLGENTDKKEDLTPHLEAIEAFKFCMLSGGDTAEVLAQLALDLARKKRGKVKQ